LEFFDLACKKKHLLNANYNLDIINDLFDPR